MLSKRTLGETMDIILAILKRQTTLPAYDKKQIKRNLSKKNSNVFIASKEGNRRTSKKELSRLSDALLKDLKNLNKRLIKEEKKPFTITSALGNAEWELEPSFMLTNVPEEEMVEIHKLSKKYKQESIAVSKKNETGASFVQPDGTVTDKYKKMVMDANALYSTDFPTGDRLTFEKQDTFIKEKKLGQKEEWFDMIKSNTIAKKRSKADMWWINFSNSIMQDEIPFTIKKDKDGNDLYVKYSNLGRDNKRQVVWYLKHGEKNSKSRNVFFQNIKQEMSRESDYRSHIEDGIRGGSND